MTSPKRPGNPVGRPRRMAAGEADTRTRVLDHAQALLEERGYAGMSMDDVARAAGLTKGTLYHHFGGGKDALILAVARRSLERHGGGLSAAIAGAPDVRGRLEAVARWTLREGGRPDRVLRDTARFLPQEYGEALRQDFMAQMYAPVEAVLRRAVETGELPVHDTEFTVWAFLGLLSEFSELQRLLSRPQLERQIVDLLLNGVQRGSAPGGAEPTH